MESELDIAGYIGHLKRRIWILIVPIIVLTLASLVATRFMTPLYQARATILVESQQIPTDLASPTVIANASERIKVIEQRLLARDNLLEVANKFDLYIGEPARRSPTELVEAMRDAISIDQIDVGGAARRSGTLIGFTVGFAYSNPVIAARVTNDLTNAILSQNLESRLGRASETSKFLESQKASIEKRLLALEAEIANFKRDNDEALPDTLGLRRTRLSDLTLQISQLDRRITAINGGTNADLLTADGQRDSGLVFSLQSKKIEYAAAVEQLEELKPLAEKGIVARNRVRDLERSIALMELSIGSLESQLASLGGGLPGDDLVLQLTDMRAELSQEADRLTESISRTPVVEIELNALNRDYETLQAEYRQAQARLEDALTGERLEQDRQSERFEVIEQATAPSQPTSPNSTRVVMVGSFGGIAMGMGLVVLLTLLDRRIYTASDLQKRLQMQPIAVIPLVVRQEEVQASRNRLLIMVAAAGIVAVGGLLAVHIFYLPLDYLAGRAVQMVFR